MSESNPPMEMVFIEWIDSGFSIINDWKPISKYLSNFKFDDMIVQTVGFVAYEDKDFVAITTSWSESTESAFGLQIIAQSNIKFRLILG